MPYLFLAQPMAIWRAKEWIRIQVGMVWWIVLKDKIEYLDSGNHFLKIDGHFVAEGGQTGT